MKVLQINTVSGHGSTGRTCIELATALQDKGHESYIAYGQGVSKFENSIKIGSILENHFHNVTSRLFGNQGYYTKRGTKKLIKYIKQIKPDIIHLRNLHGNYINLKLLFNYLAKVDTAIVWSLHDCWAYTGKCSHYTNVACYKWQSECHHCPQVKKYPPSLIFDRSRKMYHDKKNWFTAVKNMTIVPVSNWLASETEKSFLVKYPIVAIYNWIDHTIFKPLKGNIKNKYGIDNNKFVILGVSAGWKKEDSKLLDILKLSELISEDMQIVLIGHAKEPECIPENIIHLPYIHCADELAEVYSMADAYVHTSVEDTFGKVIAEAMSCGTPAIVYNSTACPEIVGEGCGYIVGKRDVRGIYNALLKIKKNGKHSYSKFCIEYVKNNFDYQENTSKTIELYKRVLKK